MKKNRSLLILFILLFANSYMVLSQTITVTIGDFNFYNPFDQFPAPYGRYYESTHQQFLIRASELQNAGGEAGEIESLAFNVAQIITGGDPLPDYTIKMKHTNDTYITTMDMADLTEVYYSSSYNASIGWNTHYFNTPFLWDGSSNIIVDICNDLSVNPSTSFNSGAYNSLYSYNCYVYGGSNFSNQCDETNVTDHLYAKPDFKMVITPSVPECANLGFPEDQATDISRTVELDWSQGSSYVTDYDVYFGTSPNPPFATNTTSSDYSPGTLAALTTYYWKIVPKNISGGAIGCDVWSFTTNSGLADCSIIDYPPAGSTDILINPVLEWQSTSGAINYNVYAGTDPNPEFIGSTSGTSYNADFVNEPNTTYYWRIEPITIYGSNDTCGVHSFTTYTYCPANPIPADGQTDQLTYQNLSWDPVVDAEMYYIYLGKNDDPELIDSTLSNSYFHTDLDHNSQYYWKIVTKLPSSISSGCDVWSFNTKGNTHWFIKTNGNDENDGLSWDQAKSNLSELMSTAQCGDSIHVAEGDYYPLIDTLFNLNPVDIRTLTFPLKAGVDLLGGYPASASGSDLQTSLLVYRDYASYTTILNGDRGIANNKTDNCYHVVTMIGENIGTSLIDGFDVLNGYSEFTYNYDYFGAAIILRNKQLEISNCYFTDNETFGASGIYAKKSIIKIHNSFFEYNDAGAAVFAESYSKLSISGSCFFRNFKAVKIWNYSILESDNTTYWWNTMDDYDIDMNNAGDDLKYSSYIRSSTVFQFGKSNGGHVFFDNSIIGGISNVSQIYYRYSIEGWNYYDGNGSTTSVSPYYYWMEYPPVNNGGNTLTCKLLPYNGENPAVGTGNPEYGGHQDQRGVLRADVPCVGAYEAPYSMSSDILINDYSICEGESAVLNVSSITVENPVFKWYSNSSLMTLIHTGSEYITPVLNNSIYYYITVENDSIYANPKGFAKEVLVNVNSTPSVVYQPSPIIECLGYPANFHVSSIGKDLSFQWYKNNSLLAGAIDSILLFENLNESDIGMYYCEIFSSCGGSINTDIVELSYFLQPEVLVNPVNDTISIGETALFSLEAIGDSLGYNWQIDSGSGFISLEETYPYSGVNSNTLTIENVQTIMNDYNFRCMVSGYCEPSELSDTVKIYAVSPPQILLNVQDLEVCVEEPALFYIQAEGSDLNYQWQLDEGMGFLSLDNNSLYSGCQNDTLHIASPTKLMSGNQYRCIAYNYVDSLFSDEAYLYVDETSPVITSIHEDQVVFANESCEAFIVDYISEVVATDNCDTNLVITQLPIAGTIITGPENIITLSVVDDVGNYANVTFNVAVVDTISPEITSTHEDQVLYANDNCEASLPDYTSELTAIDNCDTNLGITQDPVAGSMISGMTTAVFLTVSDDAGNTDEVNFNVSVVDTLSPEITSTHEDQVLDANDNCDASLPDYTSEVTATDNCDMILDVTQLPTTGTIISGAANQVTLTVTDDDGNFAEVLFNVAVVDNTDPVITSTHEDQAIGNGTECDVNLPDYTGDVIATDNCDDDLDVTQVPVAGTTISGMTNMVVLMATDDSGNAFEVSFNVEVVDNVSPVITSTHEDQIIDANENCEASLPDYTSELSATDNCDTNLDVAQLPIAGTVISGNTNTVVLTVSDDAGNYTEVSFDVSVIDNSAPEIISIHEDQTIDADENCQAIMPDFAADLEATDNCTEDLDVVQIPVPGSIITNNIYEIKLTVTDDNNNFDQVFFNLEMIDVIFPEIICIDDQTIYLAEGQFLYTVQGTEFDPVYVEDNCGIESVINNFNNLETLEGAEFPADTTTIVWSTIDESGNETECSFDLVVNAFAGSNELLARGILIFPNPTTGIINFDFGKNDIQQIEVLDLSGKMIAKKTEVQQIETIDLSCFGNSVYILSIQSDKRIFKTKIVKR